MRYGQKIIRKLSEKEARLAGAEGEGLLGW